MLQNITESFLISAMFSNKVERFSRPFEIKQLNNFIYLHKMERNYPRRMKNTISFRSSSLL